MKRIFSLVLAVCLMLGVFCVLPIAANAEGETAGPHTVTVGVNTNLRGWDGTYWYVHYWNEDRSLTGDVNLTSLGYQREKELTDEYPELDEKVYDMYSAEVPAEADGYCVYWMNNEVTYWCTTGGDGSFADYNTAYVFKYGYNEDLTAKYFNEVQTTNTVFFTDGRGWKLSEHVCVHYWNDDYNTKWRGVPMTYRYTDPDTGYNVYSAEIPTDAASMIFNGLYGDYNEQQQTSDISEIVDHRNYMFSNDGNLTSNSFAPLVTAYSLSLKDEIGVNFYVWCNKELYTGDFTATYVYGTGSYRKEHTAAVSVPTGDFEGANLKIACPVNARSMTDTVTMTLMAGDEVVMTADYKITDYCASAATAYSDRSDLKNVLCAMLDYGGAVQRYFKYNKNDYADDPKYIEMIENFDWETLEAPAQLDDSSTDIKDVDNNGALNDGTRGVFYKGAVLSATGKTAIRLYFDLVYPENRPTVTVNGVEYDFVQSKNADRGWYIEFPVPATGIFDDNTVEFSTNEGVWENTYNAANYYNAIMGSTDNADYLAAQPSLGRLYWYSYYAKEVQN